LFRSNSNSQSLDSLGSEISKSKDNKLKREWDQLTNHVRNLADEQKAFSYLRNTLNENQKKNYNENWFQDLFSLPPGKVATKRDVNEARKRLLQGELGYNYEKVSGELLKLYAPRIAALEETGQHDKIAQFKNELAPEKIKDLYLKNPAELGKMIRAAEDSKDKSKEFWMASYHAAVLSDSSAKLARFSMATLEDRKLGRLEKFKQKLFGINPEKPSISNQVQKFINSYPGLDKSIAELLSTQNGLAELQEKIPEIDRNLADLEAKRDALLAKGGKLGARHATALAVAEMWQSQRVESKNFTLYAGQLQEKLAPLGINTNTYPDLPVWLEGIDKEGVEVWLDKQAQELPRIQSDMALERHKIAADMQTLADQFQDALKDLTKLGQKAAENNTRFDTAKTTSLKSAGLEGWDAQTLPGLFKEFDSKFFSNYDNHLKREGKTKQLRDGLAGIHKTYNQASQLDKDIADGNIPLAQVPQYVAQLRNQLDQSAQKIVDLKDHNFATGGGGERDQFKKALLAQAKDWPRTPLEEMKFLVSQRLDRLEAFAAMKSIEKDGVEAIQNDDDLRVEIGDEEDSNLNLISQSGFEQIDDRFQRAMNRQGNHQQV
jgi:predicted peroxiredoxin